MIRRIGCMTLCAVGAPIDHATIHKKPHSFLTSFLDRHFVSPPTLHVMLGETNHRHITATVDLESVHHPILSAAFVLVDDDCDATDIATADGLIMIHDRGPKVASLVLGPSFGDAMSRRQLAALDGTLQPIKAELQNQGVDVLSVKHILLTGLHSQLLVDGAISGLLATFPVAKLVCSPVCTGLLIDSEKFAEHRDRLLKSVGRRLKIPLPNQLLRQREEWAGALQKMLFADIPPDRVHTVALGDTFSVVPQRPLTVVGSGLSGCGLILQDSATQSIFTGSALGKFMPWMRHYASKLPSSCRAADHYAHLPLVDADNPTVAVDVAAAYLERGFCKPGDSQSLCNFLVTKTSAMRFFVDSFGVIERPEAFQELHERLMQDISLITAELAAALRRDRPVGQDRVDELFAKLCKKLLRCCAFDDNIPLEQLDPNRRPGTDRSKVKAAMQTSYVHPPMHQLKADVIHRMAGNIMLNAIADASSAAPAPPHRIAPTRRDGPSATMPRQAREEEAKLVFSVRDVSELLSANGLSKFATVATENAIDGAVFMTLSTHDMHSVFAPSVSELEKLKRLQRAQQEAAKAVRDRRTGRSERHRTDA